MLRCCALRFKVRLNVTELVMKLRQYHDKPSEFVEKTTVNIWVAAGYLAWTKMGRWWIYRKQNANINVYTHVHTRTHRHICVCEFVCVCVRIGVCCVCVCVHLSLSIFVCVSLTFSLVGLGYCLTKQNRPVLQSWIYYYILCSTFLCIFPGKYWKNRVKFIHKIKGCF